MPPGTTDWQRRVGPEAWTTHHTGGPFQALTLQRLPEKAPRTTRTRPGPHVCNFHARSEANVTRWVGEGHATVHVVEWGAGNGGGHRHPLQNLWSEITDKQQVF